MSSQVQGEDTSKIYNGGESRGSVSGRKKLNPIVLTSSEGSSGPSCPTRSGDPNQSLDGDLASQVYHANSADTAVVDHGQSLVRITTAAAAAAAVAMRTVAAATTNSRTTIKLIESQPDDAR